ncbi:MAG TPA: Holliday junction branch migration protein RuvA, partial [Candidatus Latescibacteria bacterium]|nr:Holliday junction branch migration protein RuvA [Candidatus Latescibacterota bacterium]
MIRHLRGLLLRRSPADVVVDVGGVGYGLAISLATYDRLPEEGEEAEFFTYTHVREDRLQLFGFAEEAELSMFELLIGVSGIGPTSALTVLSGIPLNALRTA